LVPKNSQHSAQTSRQHSLAYAKPGYNHIIHPLHVRCWFNSNRREAATPDCLDGQLARYTGRTSPIGDYLDKTLDVLKIGIINLGMGLAAVRLTGHGYYLMLALLSCFGFLFRYYIKLETIFSAVNNDKDYLDKSRSRRWALYAHFDSRKSEISGFREQLLWFWDRHHSMLALDEAEHVTFGALAALVGRPDLWLWLFAVGQIIIALARLVQRGQQLSKLPNSLTYPLRK
jgi:hypothetical protein